MSVIKFIRFILIFVVFSLLVWFTWMNFVPLGTLKVKKDVEKPSPYFSDFYPSVRMRGIERDETGNVFRTMIVDPVYFDLLMPRQFAEAEVRIKYQKTQDQPLFVGLKKTNEPWAFDFRKLLDKGNGWQMGKVDFILYPFLIDDRTLHFVLSSPNLDINLKEIKISQIEVILKKEPWTWENFLPKAKRYLSKHLFFL